MLERYIVVVPRIVMLFFLVTLQDVHVFFSRLLPELQPDWLGVQKNKQTQRHQLALF